MDIPEEKLSRLRQFRKIEASLADGSFLLLVGLAVRYASWISMSGVFEKIIVGSNGAPEAEHAVEIAISLAECIGAKVVLLGVATPPSAEAQAEGYALNDPAAVKQRLMAQLKRMVDSAKARGVDIVAEVDEGDPEKQIEKHASAEGADLIIVGHRNVSRVRHWLERSTSEALLHKAKTSILVVHSPEKKS
jgi:nucleotide-binding universal stress UspA family protein